MIEPPDPAAVAALVGEDGRRAGRRRPAAEPGRRARESRPAAAASSALELAALLAVPVETYDERLTTRMAQASRRAGAAAARGLARRRPSARGLSCLAEPSREGETDD